MSECIGGYKVDFLSSNDVKPLITVQLLLYSYSNESKFIPFKVVPFSKGRASISNRVVSPGSSPLLLSVDRCKGFCDSFSVFCFIPDFNL